MANNFITQNVEIWCKTFRKTLRKTRAIFCAFPKIHQIHVYKLFIPPTFSYFPTNFLTATPPLSLNNLFHYSTDPTITTTNIFNNKII